MVKYRSLMVLALMVISGCVSIERDIYFKEKSSEDEKTMEANRPGGIFRFSPLSVTDQYDRSVQVSVLNHASGSYLWGIVIPVIPVFFLPEFKFSLDKNEKLKIQCLIQPYYGPQFLETYEHFGNTKLTRLNEKGLELAKKLDKLDLDTCTSATVHSMNGKFYQPIKIESSADPKYKSVIFTFDLPASAMTEFKVSIDEIQLNTGERLKTKIEFSPILEDWTRYYIPKLAP